MEYIADDRERTSPDAYYQSLSAEQLAAIEAVARDLWPPFIEATAAHVPDGRSKIVFDRYHVMLHRNNAVDQVRRSEHRQRQAEGDDTLKGTKCLWLFAAENVPESQAGRFAALRAMDLKTGRAWAIKEELRDPWDYRRRGWALRHWKRGYFRATDSRLKPVVRAARTIHGHLGKVLTYFDHRITKAMSEGLNSQIEAMKRTRMATAIGST